MQKKVWIFQYPREVRAKGSDRASYYVGWYDNGGKRRSESCGPGARGKTAAERLQRKLHSELDMGVHQPEGKTKWSKFRKEYEEKVVSTLAPQSREQVKSALDHFQRIGRLGRMDQIKTATIDTFIATRQTERGKKQKSRVSPATVNKDLRFIKAALRVAYDWDYLPKVPKIRMLREPEKIVQYVTPEHFTLIYQQACGKAVLPDYKGQKSSAETWWKALVTSAYMTGWRIRELLALRVEDVDFDKLTVITRHGDNKGKRDELVPIHPVVAEHLKALIDTHRCIFHWPHSQSDLWAEFRRIQEAVGIHLVCRESHEHTPPCHVYGFHDFRRAFATVNAKRIKPEALQKMMRHRAYATTLGYVNLAEQIEEAVEQLQVPDVLQEPDHPTSGAERDPGAANPTGD